MRVATWNLQRPGSPASERGRGLLHCMRQVDADIWVLTETHEAMTPGDGYVGTATSGSDREQSPGEQWTMIWSRLPVTIARAAHAVGDGNPIRRGKRYSVGLAGRAP